MFDAAVGRLLVSLHVHRRSYLSLVSLLVVLIWDAPMVNRAIILDLYNGQLCRRCLRSLLLSIW